MCTEHGLTRSGLEPTIYRTRGEHANDYSTDESLWWAFLVCFSANTYIVRARIQDFKLGEGRTLKICAERRDAQNILGISCEKITILRQKIIYFSNYFFFGGGGGARCAPTLDPPLLST